MRVVVPLGRGCRRVGVGRGWGRARWRMEPGGRPVGPVRGGCVVWGGWSAGPVGRAGSSVVERRVRRVALVWHFADVGGRRVIPRAYPRGSRRARAATPLGVRRLPPAWRCPGTVGCRTVEACATPTGSSVRGGGPATGRPGHRRRRGRGTATSRPRRSRGRTGRRLRGRQAAGRLGCGMGKVAIRPCCRVVGTAAGRLGRGRRRAAIGSRRLGYKTAPGRLSRHGTGTVFSPRRRHGTATAVGRQGCLGSGTEVGRPRRRGGVGGRTRPAERSGTAAGTTTGPAER